MAFANSRNIKIDNSKFTEIHGDSFTDSFNNVGSVSISKAEPGLVPLFNLTSPGAAFDSADRFPPAKCHPGTRTEIIEKIMAWIHKVKPSIKGGEDEVQGRVIPWKRARRSSNDESGNDHSNEDVHFPPQKRARRGSNDEDRSETDGHLNFHWSIHESYDGDRVLWLHGPAGAGKSAIAQTVAEACDERGLLAASFFFSRGRPRRDSIDHLFITIAYQLAISIPQFKPALLQNLTGDLSILHKDIPSQLKKLIIEPLRSAMSSSSTQPKSPPYIVIIDGLDECTGSIPQNRILAHIQELVCHSNLPIRFLVVSRPEYNIQEAFDGAPLSRFSAERISLYGAHKAYHDVREYLLHEFEGIYTSPMHRPWMVNVPKPWPSRPTVDRLVKQSDGYFIYASTLIKFMDQEDLSPVDQLRITLTRSSESESSGPFGELDNLYRQILSAQRNTELLRIILAAIFTDVPLDVIAGLFCLDPGQVLVVVRRLSAVLAPSSSYVTFGGVLLKPVHASFSDFIFDPARAGIFHVDPQSIWAQTTRAMLDCMGRCAWTSEGSPLAVKPQPSLCEAAAVTPQFSFIEKAAVKPRSSLFLAAHFAFRALFYFSKAGEADRDTLVQEITAIDPQRWVPLPPEGQHPAWHDEAYDELKKVCAWSLEKLFERTEAVKIDFRLKQYWDTVRKMAFRRLLAPLSPQDEMIGYAFTIIATLHDDSQWIHRFLRLERPLPYRTLEIYEILSYLLYRGSLSDLKVYLSSKDAPSELFDFETSHTHLAHQCMTFLTEDVDQLLARAHQNLMDHPPVYLGLRWLLKHFYRETRAQNYARLNWAKHLKRAKPGDERLLEHLREIDRRFFSDEEYFSGGIACLEACQVQDFPSSWPPDQHTRTYAQLVPFTKDKSPSISVDEQSLMDLRMVPLFFMRNDVWNAFEVISWLKKSSHTPQGLVERWEDYHKDSRTRLEHAGREFLHGCRGSSEGYSYGRRLFESLYQIKPWDGQWDIGHEVEVHFLGKILKEYERDYEAEKKFGHVE